MVAIRSSLVNTKQYRNDMIKAFTIKLEKAKDEYDALMLHISEKREILANVAYKFDIAINDYPEFQQNKYINRRLEDAAKGLYACKSNNFELKHLYFKLMSYAVDLRKIHEAEEKIRLYEKCINLSPGEYNNIVRTFYTAVHNNMVLTGHAYRFEHNLGYVCINRVLNTGCKIVDYKATKLHRKELEAQGAHIWNKEEAEFCEKNGLKYDAVIPYVYKQDESWYQLALCSCSINKGFAYRASFIDYRDVSARNCTNEDLIKRCDYDKEKICNLHVSMKVKLALCLNVDKILYTKFIRNENQKQYNASPSNRKS